MSKGFFTIAQGDRYVRYAYALALSLQLSQKEYKDLSIGITPGYSVPEKYAKAFDQIIEIPFGDHAKDSDWKLENEWKSIYMSPYDETIKLDADMIFPEDISTWWEFLSKNDYTFAENAATYRGEIVDSDYYRKTFTMNELPNVYTAFFYFKKTEKSYELFKMAEFIYYNWETFFYEFLEPVNRPKYVSTDVVFALASKIVGHEAVTKHLNMPIFVHMKSYLQNWELESRLNKTLPDDWQQIVKTYFTDDCELFIGNHKQYLPVHYHLKDWLTDEIIEQLEKKVGFR